ncbi:MAG TPA: hypothetical protein PK739_10805, partial [Methanoculleus sp.]|nr:hypothetical protein [Methanoculleus sp.]
ACTSLFGGPELTDIPSNDRIPDIHLFDTGRSYGIGYHPIPLMTEGAEMAIEIPGAGDCREGRG